MAKAEKKVKFGNMTYAELKKWSKDHDDEWNSGIPDWGDDYFEALGSAAKKEFPMMTLAQLNEIWVNMDESEYDTAGDICHAQMMQQEPIISLLDKIKDQNLLIAKLQMSIEVLLKQHEDEPANIKVGQLNRLKGGI